MLPYRLAEVERKAESITVTEIVVIVIDIVTARACVVAARLIRGRCLGAIRPVARL